MSKFFEGVGHFERKFQTETGSLTNAVDVGKVKNNCPFVWYQNIRSVLLGFITNHTCGRDRQADRITTANTARR